MDVKGVFDHVFKNQLFIRMIELDIDIDLIAQTKSFLIDKKIQLGIDKYNHKKSNIETGIPQDLRVLPILFLIYISMVFEVITDNIPIITSLLFVDDLGFIALGTSIQEISKKLEIVALSVL